MILEAIVRSDSMFYRIAVEQYVRHAPVPFADRCTACRASSCLVRVHAAEVIRAAGIDPAYTTATATAGRGALDPRADQAAATPYRPEHSGDAMTHSAETLQTPGEHADPYILRGFIWCAGCDLLMIPVLVTSGERHYDCPNRECPRSPVPAERVERLVWDHFAFLNQMSADEVPPEGRREALRQFLAKIWIGADVDQPYFDWRD